MKKYLPKETAFYNIHKKRNAKIVSFAGYEMPVQYENGIVSEHKKVRKSVGMFDLSHMGEFIVKGEKRLDFIQKMTTNDASKLEIGQIQYTNMCYPNGGIVDDLLVYREKDIFYLVANASNIDKDFEWLKTNLIEGVKLQNVSDKTALIAVQGPYSEKVMQKLVNENLVNLRYYYFIRTKIADVPVILSRTGYTGEDGFEIYFTQLDKAENLWNKIEKAGEEFEIEPIGLGARDTLRLEMKYPLYGNDIDENTNPLEAGLKWIVKFKKNDFIGKETLLKIREEKIQKKLVAFKMSEKGIPRPHYEIFKNGQQIGEVRSGTISPSLNIGIGTGYVKRDFMKIGTEIEIKIREKYLKAEIVNPPFYKNGTLKM